VNAQPNITGLLPEGQTMTSSVTSFEFEGHKVRVIDRAGNPRWVLSDVCQVLEIANPRDAASRLDDDEMGVATIDTLGGPQKTAIISESGLNNLILTSRKPAARRFTKWITREPGGAASTPTSAGTTRAASTATN
jgi:prophage antirepressor-like protein